MHISAAHVGGQDIITRQDFLKSRNHHLASGTNLSNEQTIQIQAIALGHGHVITALFAIALFSITRLAHIAEFHRFYATLRATASNLSFRHGFYNIF